LRRILVVGASSGIGRALSAQCLARGDAVVLAARRRALLDEVIAGSHRPVSASGSPSASASAAPPALALACDTSDPDSCDAVVAAAAAFLEGHGGLDTIVYAAGTAPLGSLTSTTATQWHEILATNLVGAALVVSAALPHLDRHRGHSAVVLLSSSSVDTPWPGLVAYAASKGGLNQLALGLRAEAEGVRTIRVAVGPTATSFADGWDPDRFATYFEQWAAEGHLRHEVLEPDWTASAILAALDDPDSPDDLSVIGPEAS
jgi:NAD(P)-dependent dehydrogenase (short-subunit alcohol dehydrogenase family)